MKGLKILAALCFVVFLTVSARALELCTNNATQSRYTASGCSYTTETRKCCSRTWCDWGVTTCASCTATSETRNCSGNVANTTSGTQTRTRLVNSTCGSCSYGSWSSWSGTCTCKSGYTWSGSRCDENVTYQGYWTKATSHYYCNIYGDGQCAGGVREGWDGYSCIPSNSITSCVSSFQCYYWQCKQYSGGGTIKPDKPIIDLEQPFEP